MSYNEIEINGQTVQGHRYSGGGCVSTSNQVNAGTYSYTVVNDCMLHINAGMSDSNSSRKIEINVNDVLCDGYSLAYTSTRLNVDFNIPVKAGDVVKIVSTISSCYVQIYEVIYR